MAVGFRKPLTQYREQYRSAMCTDPNLSPGDLLRMMEAIHNDCTNTGRALTLVPLDMLADLVHRHSVKEEVQFDRLLLGMRLFAEHMSAVKRCRFEDFLARTGQKTHFYKGAAKAVL